MLIQEQGCCVPALGTELADISRCVALNHKALSFLCRYTPKLTCTYGHACIGVSMQRTQLLNPTAFHSFAITL